MNNKKYMTAGVFFIIVAIGVGITYYLDPSVLNNIFEINNATINAVSDGDPAGIVGTSSSVADTDSEMSGSDGASPAISGQQSSQKKNISANAEIVSGQYDDSRADTATVASSGDVSVAVAATNDAITTIATSSCSFPAAAPATTTKEIILNEIAWMGSPSSSTAEWIEIKNDSGNVVDLSGWAIENISGKIKIVFSSDDSIAPGAYQLFARGNALPSASTTQTYSGDLTNAGDVIAITDARCNISDYLDASHGWPGGDNSTKQTLERDADGSGWHTSVSPGGTPGVENSSAPVAPIATTTVRTSTMQTQPAEEPSEPSQINIAPSSDTTVIAPTSSAASSPITDSAGDENANSSTTLPVAAESGGASGVGHILIAAVQIAGASSSNDLIKLYNPSASPVDMSGWKLHKRSNTGTDYSVKVFPAGSTVGSGQYFTWANATDGFSETAGANISSTETLSVDNSVALMDGVGNIIDAVAWGTGTDQYGEGPPYPTSPAANQLLVRRLSEGTMVDTDNNTNDFILQ